MYKNFIMLNSNTFRSKLLKFILILNLFSIFLVVLYGIYFFKKKDDIHYIIDRINKVNIILLMDIKSQNDFIKYDAVDTNYYKNQTSINIDTHRRLSRNLSDLLVSLRGEKYISLLNVESDIDSLSHLINKINREFEKIIVSIRLRGFKDFGVEGEMRKYAHMLENSEMNETMILSLRRHEKDYILRKDPVYIEKLNHLGNDFKNYISFRSDIGGPIKDSITDILDKYILEFNKLVKIEEELGIYQNDGLKQVLEELFDRSTIYIEQINNKVSLEKNEMFLNLEINSLWFLSLLILTNILASVYLSRHITNPLKALTGVISRITESNFKISDFQEIRQADKEIHILVSEFKNMLKQLRTRERERDTAESELRESEAKFKNLADMLPLSVFEADSDCYCTYFNKTLIDTFGYRLVQKDNKIKISDIIRTDCDSFFDINSSLGIDYMAFGNNGEDMPVLLYTSRIIKNDICIGLRGIIVDITEKKKYTEELEIQKLRAEKSDKLKSAFLANMSHEIRTPLNSIVGFSQILTQQGLSDETRLEYANYISNSSDLLLKIINDILDIARIESGELIITKSVFDLNDLIERVGIQIKEMRKTRKKTDIEIKIFKQSGHNEFFINSDPYRLEQVLINLLSNAIKFTNSGLIEFGYRITDMSKVEFFVKDTGIGISGDKIDIIFDRFTQVEEVHNKQYEGTGLGLSISKNIVQLLGGKIWVESKPGIGSVFFFDIPLTISYTLDNLKNRRSEEETDPKLFKDLPILIAEDIENNFLFFREGLKPFGMKIIRAVNGAEAVDIIRTNQNISIVLMDMRMPVMDGYEATQKIKELNPRIRIIATTAYALSGEKEKCLNAGCDYYLSKPIRIDNLMEKIADFIKLDMPHPKRYVSETI